jgi:hypothetical protein
MRIFNHAISLSAAGLVLLAGCSKQVSTTGSAPISTTADGPVEMKIKWVTGKRYNEEMSVNRTVKLDLPSLPKPTEQLWTSTQDYTVSVLTNLPGGGAELEMQFTGMKLESKLGQKVTFAFDSESDPASDKRNTLSPIFRKMIGVPLKYELDADGKVTDIVGLNELISQLSGKNPQVQSLVKGVLDRDLMERIVERGEGLPPGPVKIGDHWPIHLDAPTGTAGNLSLDMKYTLRGWQQHQNRRCAVMEFVGDIITKPGTSVPDNGMEASIDKGTMEGTAWYDPELGMIVDVASKENMSLKLVMQGKTSYNPTIQSMSMKLLTVEDNAQ